MKMICTTTLQLPINVLLIILSVFVSIVVEIMMSIIVMSLMTRIILHKTELSFERRGILINIIVAVVDYILMVVGILKVKGIMNRTSLEWPILPMSITMVFIDLMEFGWPFVVSVRSGVVLLLPTLLVFKMLPFQQDPPTASLALTYSVAFVLPLLPPPIMSLEQQHLFWIL